LLLRDFVHSKTLPNTRIYPLAAGSGWFRAYVNYRRAAIMIIAALFLTILLIVQFGRAVKLGTEVDVAFARARQLLHEAYKENHHVRPLPLSLAKVTAARRLA
jgi:hypothetical protein